MKVTFWEEIETRRAWLGNMYCPNCVFGKYQIHHQLEPKTDLSWWISCPNCGHEGTPGFTRKDAIELWQYENSGWL